MRYVSFAMATIFVAFATLQYNDPDPYIWIPAYGLVALLSYLHAFRRPVPATSTLITAIAFLSWAIVSYTQTTGRWWDGEVERETGGLVICAVWSLILWWRSKREVKEK
ncbi:MAG: transmembrane 220 family protein [Bacteroidetes bacterium]|nr:transmembrane 220 family protein [Bacteroidota bacterium]